MGRFLFERGVYVTMAAFPLVPKNEVGVRIQITAANTDDEVEHLVSALRGLRERFALQQPADSSG
jgi:7-keto-8-aminopelargonate synthetase-like enzyme